MAPLWGRLFLLVSPYSKHNVTRTVRAEEKDDERILFRILWILFEARVFHEISGRVEKMNESEVATTIVNY